ncbi:colanic acid biosynthesis acetyltransferase WcaF [Urechidicola sp. KH5]
MIQDLSLYRTPEGFRGRSKFRVQLWWLVQGTLFKLSPQFLYNWRRFLLRLFGAKIGRKAIIRPSVEITYPWKVNIGDYSWIGDGVVLYSLGEIIIGKNTVVSQKSYLCTGTHDYTKIEFPILSRKIIIEDECWLATDVYVSPGVHIGKGTIVGARSSVFSDLPSGKVCLGSPAKIIKNR